MRPEGACQRQRSARIFLSGAVVNSSVLRTPSLNRPLNDSEKPFSHGDPGSMYTAVLVALRMKSGAG
jgi:hypothetical protein